ncbi:MAG: hypothetical protein MK212_03915 [Saprospiraceae bacterium]|nr:hypothetical protein [Saprospiraceae bacterium]
MLRSITIVICIFIFSLSSNKVQAQDIDKVAKKTAKVMCSCINKELSVLDKDMLDIFVKMIELESEESGKGQDYILELSQDQQLKFMKQINALADSDGGNISNCLNNSGIKSSIGKVSTISDMDEDQFLNLIIEKMSSLKKCNAAYKVIKAGLNGTFQSGGIRS